MHSSDEEVSDSAAGDSVRALSPEMVPTLTLA